MKHKLIVGYRLDLQIIIKINQFLNPLVICLLPQSRKKFTGFTGRTKDQTFPPFHQLAFGNPWTTVKVI